MKKSLVYFFGIITGILIAIGGWYLKDKVHLFNTTDKPALSLTEKPGEIMDIEVFQVFHVLPEGSALAYGYADTEMVNLLPMLGARAVNFASCIVLLPPTEGKSYYDDQFIDVPRGHCVRQIGTYRYKTKDDSIKTIPVVRIMKK